MATWKELAPPPIPPPRSAVARFALSWSPALVVVALAWLLGLHELAVVVFVLSLGVTLAATRSERFRHGLEQVMSAVGRGVAVVVGGLLQSVVFAVVFLPAWAVSRLVRRDPLDLSAGRQLGTGWIDRGERPHDDLVAHVFSLERAPREPSPVGRALSMVPFVLGLLAIVVTLDVVVGSAVHDEDPEPVLPNEQQIADATSDAPWFADYWNELVAIEHRADPFVQATPEDFAGEYVTITDGRRRSVEPAGTDAEAPVVAVFGGSTVWGEGQRDDHTIPSVLARLAAADGLAVRFENHAQRGDTLFSELLRLERLLAGAGPAPDLVVFVDGPDEVAVQSELLLGQPSRYGLSASIAATEDDTDTRSLWARYTDASLISDVVRWTKGAFAVLPAAAEGPETPEPHPDHESAPEEVASAAIGVYERGLGLSRFIARRAGVPVRHAWQPTQASSSPDSAYALATSELPSGVFDLSDALTDPPGPVYLDGIHTNELGARLVAEALYDRLLPDLRELTEPGR